jgi:YaiO family outer membrane protein
VKFVTAICVLGLSLAAIASVSAQDRTALYRDGVAARLAGRFDEAAKQLAEAVRVAPDDADAHVQLGLALMPLKRYDEAERAFRRTLELAPNYTDAEIGLARLLYFRGQFETAHSDVKTVLAKHPDNGDARDLAVQISKAIAARATAKRKAARNATRNRAATRRASTPAPLLSAPTTSAEASQISRRWRIDLEGGWSQLTAGRRDWLEANARVAYEAVHGTAVSAAVESARRYGLLDAYLEGRIDHRFTPSLSAYAFIGGTPSADFLPKAAGGGGLAARLYQQRGVINATVLTLDTRIAEYTTGTTRTASPGVEQYLFEGRVWLTSKWINVLDENSSYLQGYLVRADVIMAEGIRIFAGYSDAPETSEGRTLETRALFGGIVYDLNAATTLRLSTSYEQRPNLYNRTSISSGVSYKF